MDLPESLRIADRDLNAVIDIVYSRAKDILSTPLHMHYTDHSIGHSERIIVIVDKLIKDVCFLNEAEKFILVCSILLHDIGMQIPKYAFPLEENELQEIRNNHHLFSEKMIIESLDLKSENRYYLGLNSKREYVDSIAVIAKLHRKADITSLKNVVIGNNPIRLKLLAALIRLGDCLDIDSRRVQIDRLNLLSISTDSNFFWYTHHYVKGISIDKLKISLIFAFPESYKSNQINTEKITDSIKHEIEKQLSEVYFILDEFNIRLYREIIISTQYYEEILESTLPKFIKGNNLKLVSINEELKRYFSLHPDRLYNLSPRKFEELVADILKDFGFDVELTSATRDGGIDIYAYMKTQIGIFLTFVECKRWTPPNHVGIEVVQRLQGIHHTNNAHRSMIVTTSYFTQPAILESKKHENLMTLVDYNNLKKWLENYH